MSPDRPRVVVVGGGPAGLMAAEVVSGAGVAVVVHDRMPSVGRKLLMAGRGGLNLTHSEPLERFLGRYGEAGPWLAPLIEAFPPSALVAWAEGLGQPTFVGSSGRIFPKAMKASPLLRAWLRRLADRGVMIRTGSTWRGWDGEAPAFDHGREEADAVVLALGGASWPRLGSDGRWAGVLAAEGVAVAPFRPANCGFRIDWSAPFRERFAGAPLKSIALTFAGRTVRGEAVVAGYGLEGGAVYALSAALRDAIERNGSTVLEVDLRPDVAEAALAARLARSRPGESLSNRLRKAAGLSPQAAGLLREVRPGAEPGALARAIKRLPLTVVGTAPIERAISTAGGVRREAVDGTLMLHARPGVFVAGEMLDWEAPTGGYLLQATMASGVAAGRAALAWLRR